MSLPCTKHCKVSLFIQRKGQCPYDGRQGPMWSDSPFPIWHASLFLWTVWGKNVPSRDNTLEQRTCGRGKTGNYGEHGEPAKGPHGLPEPTPNQTSLQEMWADSAFRGLGNDAFWNHTNWLQLLSFHLLTKMQVLSLHFFHLENGDNSNDFLRLVLS